MCAHKHTEMSTNTYKRANNQMNWLTTRNMEKNKKKENEKEDACV